MKIDNVVNGEDDGFYLYEINVKESVRIQEN